ncbi:MAG TPA: CHAP domain-containing protein [Vicinamibacterales bacterium]|nr:CHAP domain-containing protein [Vicinamibacterales bacterium]
MALAAPAAARAADICGETVPSNRFIDGIPAYAQCAGSMTGAVYSNNGTDTATTSGGTGWVRTQSSGGYQCTELAHRYLYFKWNVTSVPNGNAGVWCDATLPSGLVKATTPVHGDLIVLAPGSCGADATTGHVGVIDVVNADTSLSVVQQNSASRSKYMMSCAACFLHVAANDGTGGDGGVPSGDAGTATDGGAGTGGATGGAAASGGTGGGGGVTTIGSAGTSGGAGTTGSGGGAGTADTGPGATPGNASGGCTVARSGGDRGRAIVLALTALVLLGGRRRRRGP